MNISSTNILSKAYNVYSQAGQDGILEHIFNKLKIERGFYIEFGAGDGIYQSNTRNLFEKGWTGILIERHKKKFKALEANYSNTDSICINESIELKNTLDTVIGKNKVDFLSIDIDGPDLEIFETIEDNLPIVACIEGGMGPYPFESRVPIEKTSLVGQSLKTVKDSVEKMGYIIVCCFQDVIIIHKDYFDKLNIPKLNAYQLYWNGFIYCPNYHIPLYLRRLRKVGRTNSLLQDILDKTQYKSVVGKGRIKEKTWGKQYKKEIDMLLYTIRSQYD